MFNFIRDIINKVVFSRKKKQIYSLSEVFTTSGVPKLTFVERNGIQKKLSEVDKNKNHAVLFLGYSKSGKTVYRKKYFDNYKYKCVYRCGSDSTINALYKSIVYELNIPRKNAVQANQGMEVYGELKSRMGAPVAAIEAKTGVKANIATGQTHKYADIDIDVNYICNNITDKDDTVIILEDYHSVDENFNKRFSEDLKHFIDEGILFVIIGIPSSPERYFKYNPDLAGRSIRINFDYLSKSEIIEIIKKGEEHLNVKFTDQTIAEIIKFSMKNAYLVQSICLEILELSKIAETQRINSTISDLGIVNKACASLANKLNEEYISIINIIRAGARAQRKGTVFNQYDEIIKAIRKTPIETLEQGLSHTEIARMTWESFSPEFINQCIENKIYRNEVSFRSSAQTLITNALVQLNDNFVKAKARKIFYINDKKLYLNDIIFKFYLDWLGYSETEKNQEENNKVEAGISA